MQTIKLIPAVLLLLLYSCSGGQNDEADNAGKAPAFQAVVTQKSLTDTAWGYTIAINQRPYIKQFTIPALEGNQLFANREQATKVGNLVAWKLNNAQHPTISKKELDSLGIIQPTHVIQKK